MQRNFVTIDVFTDNGQGGNPLAVVLDAKGLSKRQMQTLATGFNFSETTFVLPPDDPAHTARVRIFTPVAEIPFAGHPNVGTALVLARRSSPAPMQMLFEEAAGLVPVAITLADFQPVAAEITAPEPFARGANADPGKLAAALGLDATDVLIGVHRPTMATVGAPFLIAELATRAALRDATPEPARLTGLLRNTSTMGLYLYTKDGAAPSHDFHARMFFPLEGIVEDPATGSAALALVALRAMLAPAENQKLSLRIGQGADMGRPSLLLARAVKREGRVISAHVGGAGVEIKRGAFPLAGEA
jgi:trans-2,3-dihydro-3-hydroxyanthranilate isomerase